MLAGLWSSRYDVGLQNIIIYETDPLGDEEFLELGKPKCRGFKSFQPHHYINYNITVYTSFRIALVRGVIRLLSSRHTRHIRNLV